MGKIILGPKVFLVISNELNQRNVVKTQMNNDRQGKYYLIELDWNCRAKLLVYISSSLRADEWVEPTFFLRYKGK